MLARLVDPSLQKIWESASSIVLSSESTTHFPLYHIQVHVPHTFRKIHFFSQVCAFLGAPAVFIRFQAARIGPSYYMHTDQTWMGLEVILGIGRGKETLF